MPKTRLSSALLAALVLVATGFGSLPAQEPCQPGFALRPIFPVADNFGMNALEDFNGDGHLDLTIGLDFYLGDGTGSFAPGIRKPGFWPVGFDMRTDDFDGDGILDAILVGFATPTIGLYWGQRNGDPRDFFERPVRLDLGSISSSFWHMDKADFNNDGRNDIVVCSISSRNLVVLLNNGDRTFAQRRLSTAAGSSHMLTAGDFDGDGNADIAAGRGSEVSIFFGDGTGGFGTERRGALRYPTTMLSGHRFRSADLDGDGADELFATGQTWVLVYAGSQFSQEDGMPRAPAYALQVSGSVRFIEIVDMNDDGYLDVASLSEGRTGSIFKVFYGYDDPADGLSFEGGATLTTALSGHGSVLAIGDLDEDGSLDAAITTEDTFQARVILNDGACSTVTVARGDSNQDDLVNLSDAVSVLSYLFLGAGLACPAAAEVNGDRDVNLGDAVYLLNWLFQGGPPLVGEDPAPCTE